MVFAEGRSLGSLRAALESLGPPERRGAWGLHHDGTWRVQFSDSAQADVDESKQSASCTGDARDGAFLTTTALYRAETREGSRVLVAHGPYETAGIQAVNGRRGGYVAQLCLLRRTPLASRFHEAPS